jgi:hypothetical protein
MSMQTSDGCMLFLLSQFNMMQINTFLIFLVIPKAALIKLAKTFGGQENFSVFKKFYGETHLLEFINSKIQSKKPGQCIRQQIFV